MGRRQELRGAGDIVHDFYNAIEPFLERVAVEMNGGLVQPGFSRSRKDAESDSSRGRSARAFSARSPTLAASRPVP